MKRFVCLLGALVLCLTLTWPVSVAADTFVPSVGYKDGPGIEDAEINGGDAAGCVVVSSIKNAKEKTTDIYQEDRDLLLEVYDKLSDGTMKLPLENDGYVIRELVDVSFMKSACVEAAHGHKEWLAEAGNTITIKFDLGVRKSTDVLVMCYINGEWVPVESVVNNGDGTITCVFEDICPVAFCVEADAEEAAPKTGDTMGQSMILWILLMAGCFAAIVVLLVRSRKSAR